MITNVVILDPKEFDLEPEKGASILGSFTPKVVESNALANIYTQLLTKEMTPEVSQEAKDLDKKLGVIERDITSIHKKEKAFYLAGGRFVDAAKNKYLEPISQMREKLKEMAVFFETQEKLKTEEIKKEREALLKGLEVEGFEELGLGTMREDVWESYLEICKNKFAKKEEERKKIAEAAAEKQKLDALHQTRKEAVLDLWVFVTDFEKTLHLGEQSQKDYEAFVSRLNKAKEEEDKRIAALAEANAKLMKEASQREEILKKEKSLKEARAKELQPYISFIRDYNALLSLPDEEYNLELKGVKKGAELQWAADIEAKKEKERNEKRKQERLLIVAPYSQVIVDINALVAIASEKEFNLKLAEIKKKFTIFDAEQRKQKEKEENDRRSDSETFKLLLADLEALKLKHNFKAPEYISAQKSTGVLLDKIIVFLNEKNL